MITINSSWVKFFHMIYLIVWAITDLTPGYESEAYKYLFMLIPILISASILWNNGCRIKWETLVFGEHLIYLAFFVLITLAALFINEYLILDLRDIARMLLSLSYVFFILNTDGTENKDFYVDSFFFACIAVVIMNIAATFSIQNFLSINFIDSYSPFEHHLAHEFAFYFIYYYMRKKKGRILLAALMSYITLKRIHLLFVAILIVAGPFIKNIKVTNKKINLMKMCFLISPAIMELLISERFVTWFDSTFNTTFYEFTMSRLDQMVTIMWYDGSLLGLQAVDQFLNRTGTGTICHSDIIRLYQETTFVGMALFINAYFNMLKIHRNIYAFYAMLLMFTSMFGTVNLQRPHTYIMLYFLCCMDFEAVAREDRLKETRKRGRRAYSAFSPAPGPGSSAMRK